MSISDSTFAGTLCQTIVSSFKRLGRGIIRVGNRGVDQVYVEVLLLAPPRVHSEGLKFDTLIRANISGDSLHWQDRDGMFYFFVFDDKADAAAAGIALRLPLPPPPIRKRRVSMDAVSPPPSPNASAPVDLHDAAAAALNPLPPPPSPLPSCPTCVGLYTHCLVLTHRASAIRDGARALTAAEREVERLEAEVAKETVRLADAAARTATAVAAAKVAVAASAASDADWRRSFAALRRDADGVCGPVARSGRLREETASVRPHAEVAEAPDGALSHRPAAAGTTRGIPGALLVRGGVFVGHLDRRALGASLDLGSTHSPTASPRTASPRGSLVSGQTWSRSGPGPTGADQPTRAPFTPPLGYPPTLPRGCSPITRRDLVSTQKQTVRKAYALARNGRPVWGVGTGQNDTRDASDKWALRTPLLEGTSF